MNAALKQQKKYKNKAVHPKIFAMWLGVGSIIMMFAGLTSAYIVRRGVGNWVEYQLPNIFWVSTVIILASSVTLMLAYRAYQSNNIQRHRLFLALTLVLGVGFVASQYMGWQELMSYGILLEGNPSGAFLYVISGLHVAHVVGGLLFLLGFFLSSLRKTDPVAQLMLDMNPDKGLGLNLLAIYWHFVDVLWLYLFMFLMYYR